MKFPIVSRLAYDSVCSERDWLRAELEKTRDHKRRIERKERGLSEIAPKERKPIPPMPDTMKEKIRMWGDEQIQKDLETRAYNLVRGGKSWAEAEDILDRHMEDV